MINTTNPNGKTLCDKLSKRDYTGTESDIYAQLLQTILFHLTCSSQEDKFFELLETAEKEGKKIVIKDNSISNEEYFLSFPVLRLHFLLLILLPHPLISSFHNEKLLDNC